MQGKQNTMIKRIVDVCMTVLLLCLMAYQVTGEVLHEWIGMGMTALVIVHGMPDYLFFRVPFAFLDYEKAGALVFLENILILSFWAFIGTEVAIFCRNSQMKAEEKKNPLLPVVFIMSAIILGLVMIQR